MAALWSEERTEMCIELWSEGLSATRIARRLGGGVSRNAVIGKIHRLGHKRVDGGRSSMRLGALERNVRKKRRKPKASESPRFGKVKSPVPLEALPLPPEPPKPGALFKLVDLDENQCRFPYGDPKSSDFGFCGCETAPGASYCPGHQALCSTSPHVKTPRAPVEWSYSHKNTTRYHRVGRMDRVLV